MDRAGRRYTVYSARFILAYHLTMSDNKPFDWQEFLKQGVGWALAIFMVYWLTGKLSDGIDKIGTKMDLLTNEVHQGNQYTLRGAWRSTEPPAPSELPKGVPPAKE